MQQALHSQNPQPGPQERADSLALESIMTHAGLQSLDLQSQQGLLAALGIPPPPLCLDWLRASADLSPALGTPWSSLYHMRGLSMGSSIPGKVCVLSEQHKRKGPCTLGLVSPFCMGQAGIFP